MYCESVKVFFFDRKILNDKKCKREYGIRKNIVMMIGELHENCVHECYILLFFFRIFLNIILKIL